ncbi:heavy metal translocating P-type ATPase [Kushneria marisflavi]|uniref:P-type Zn(2+) transporter n=1 Tax=Kushneria marisflavi TaxID=157779 RepID=A0A240UMK3_9GAMM|nr:heavy metal translocating P-type ATPase [Kushneria marisflavi]ART62356.1 heavy metal translocating P-type ATPase [Kushneria marisflavi]RKD87465.1 Cd2+/Zn2+-exporting ATPase [Kushneria marisflavi]
MTHHREASSGSAPVFTPVLNRESASEPSSCCAPRSPSCCGGSSDHVEAATGCCGSDQGKASHDAPLPGSVREGGQLRTSMRIAQMCCPVEEQMIRRQLSAREDVERLEFNLLQRVLTVVHAPDALEEILAAIRELGFVPELADDQGRSGQEDEAPAPWGPLILSAVAACASEAVAWMSGPIWLVAVLALVAIVGCGLATWRKGWIAVRHGNLNINALMSIAVTGALLIGHWPEAAMVMVLFNLAERIEARSLSRARHAIEDLMKLAPEVATVRQGDGRWEERPVSEIAVDALIRVRPGERIGLDGEVVAGASSVNQAPITGESLPVDKSPGDSVFAGTIVEAGELECRVTHPASDSTLSRIISAVEQAQSERAPTQRFIDRFARVYTPAVVAMAALLAVVPPLLFGGGWLDWIYRSLVLLVIACPCALVISTPVTVVTGLANAARRGTLIKGGVYLEEGRRLGWVALDKTGTLTHGQPQQTHADVLVAEHPEHVASLTLGLAQRSDHPVSQALARAGELEGVTLAPFEAVEALPGLGITGLSEGVRYWLGHQGLVHERGHLDQTLKTRIEALEREGRTVVVLMDETRTLALYAVADTLRETSREAVAELHRLGVRTLMLTGDNPHAAEVIGRSVGIDRIESGLMPQDKLSHLEALAGQGRVAMIGDGINDAPALARADIGFAMGAMGTDSAIETADVALMDDDLRKVGAFIRLSRATHRILMQNIALALGIKVIFLALTVAGLGTLWMAVFADVGASVLVVLNGLRLLRHGAKDHAKTSDMATPTKVSVGANA